MHWEAVIFGPQDTPFEDGTFKLSLEFSEEYPNKPPQVKFVSKMFHPNVYADGSICLDILQVFLIWGKFCPEKVFLPQTALTSLYEKIVIFLVNLIINDKVPEVYCSFFRYFKRFYSERVRTFHPSFSKNST